MHWFLPQCRWCELRSLLDLGWQNSVHCLEILSVALWSPAGICLPQNYWFGVYNARTPSLALASSGKLQTSLVPFLFLFNNSGFLSPLFPGLGWGSLRAVALYNFRGIPVVWILRLHSVQTSTAALVTAHWSLNQFVSERTLGLPSASSCHMPL